MVGFNKNTLRNVVADAGQVIGAFRFCAQLLGQSLAHPLSRYLVAQKLQNPEGRARALERGRNSKTAIREGVKRSNNRIILGFHIRRDHTLSSPDLNLQWRFEDHAFSFYYALCRMP